MPSYAPMRVRIEKHTVCVLRFDGWHCVEFQQAMTGALDHEFASSTSFAVAADGTLLTEHPVSSHTRRFARHFARGFEAGFAAAVAAAAKGGDHATA